MEYTNTDNPFFDNETENDIASQSISVERIVDTKEKNSEKTAESALRPTTLEEFVGQTKIKKQLDIILNAAISRKTPPDHILLAGSPGLGKTTLAMIIANELDSSLRVTSGPAIQHAGDLAAILSSLDENEVLFIDEIHRLARPAQELLYVAMEDFRVDVVVGKGVGANAIPLTLPRFTVVGATTRTGLLPAPLRDRFGFIGHLDFYDDTELTQVVKRSAKLLGADIDTQTAKALASRSRGTPRIANRLLRRVQDWADVKQGGKIDINAANETLKLYDIDDCGLDKLDKEVLLAIYKRFAGGPVGLSTLAATVGEESETVEAVVEPFLVRKGYISRTPKGRVITDLGIEHAQSISE